MRKHCIEHFYHDVLLVHIKRIATVFSGVADHSGAFDQINYIHN